MNIEGMLKYQSLDREINQLNEQFRTSEATRQYNKYMKLYKQAIEDGKRMSGVIGEHFVNVDRLTKQYEKLLADIGEYNNVLDEITDVKQADYYEKQLLKLYNALEAIEKELDNVRKELMKLDADAKAFFANVNNYFMAVKKSTPEMEKVKMEIQSKAREVMLAQKELEKTIEPELVEKYKKAKEVAKFPPLVPFDEATNSCMGCGLELSKDIAAKLRQDGGLEFCPNCNRLVYKK